MNQLPRIKVQYLLLLGCLYVLSNCVNDTSQAITDREDTTIFKTLKRPNSLAVHIQTDLATILLRETTEEKYGAVMSYTDQQGATVTWKAELKPRGNLRNKICYLPPLKLDFSKADLEAAGFNPLFDEIKLVVPCDNDSLHNELVLKEYLAYQLYNEITDLSFRVQLIDLTIEDSNGQMESIHANAFLIEKDDELANRLGGRIMNPTNVNQSALQSDIVDQLCLFQYMIGNTDWYVYNMHNMEIVLAEGYSFPIPIPYDFDYAGIVDAPYATPHKSFPFSDVTERYYLGPCRTKEALAPTLQLFKDKKQSIISRCMEFKKLNPTAHVATEKYIMDFFDILENPASADSLIVAHCDKHLKMRK